VADKEQQRKFTMLTKVVHDCLGVQRRQHRLVLGLLLVALPTLGQVPTGTATFVKTDTSTGGTWKGVSGADGFDVIGNSASVPAYVTVTPSGNSSYVWASSTSDTRALNKASNPADRIAACWYSGTSFTINLAFNDSNTHQVAVYLVDWDNYNGRTERVDVIDANNNLLDIRSVASFVPGEYLVWNLSGHVILRVTNTNPSSNAVVSGLFFGAGSAPPPPTGTATFVKTDNSTAGTWKAVYGAEGFNVIGNSASVPAYVTVTPSGNSSYVWASSTSDTRALQKASNPADRIAACWYSSGSFTIDLAFSDSHTHQVAAYLLDWDNYYGRTQRVDVIDANNTLLDTRSVASFVPGKYLVWNLSGHVILRVTNTNLSSNAVVSGLFFGTLQPTVSVSVSPSSVNLLAGGSQQFSTTVLGSANSSVIWSLSSPVGTISAAGLYTAPATITTAQTVTVKATGVADPTKSATAAVTLNPPVSVTVSPGRVTLTQSQTQSFAAAVTNTGSTAVTWSLSPLVGSITAAGLYTAPASITSSQTVTVKATSAADSTKSATATVTLNPPVSVTVSPGNVTLTQSQTQSFAAAVTNTGNTAVTWSISPAAGSISASGLYTAPASITSSQTVTVMATSVADSTKSATAAVTLSPPVNVTVSPSSVTLTQSQTQSFSATVTGTSNTAVTWSLSPAVGSISAAGLYTAPASISGSQTVTVKATSAADSTKSATATVTLNPPVGVTVSPGSVTLTQSQTQTFSATVTGTSNTAVTWSISPVIGSISGSGLYTAPASIVGSQTVTVKATSAADSTKSASATVTLNPPVNVTVSPSSVSLTRSQTQSFAATVTGTSNTAVTWSISPVVGSISAAGLYTAPASIASSQTVTVKATSVADPTKSVSATVILNPPVSVTVTPASVTLTQSQTQSFSAAVTNTGNTAATWSLSPLVGNITAAGLYTAPASIASSQTVSVKATSVADPTKSATSAVTLNPPVNVTVSPANVTLTQSQTQTFSAIVTNTGNAAVTWSLSPVVGSITAAGLYTAPGSITSSQTVTVRATSVADPTKSATAASTLNPSVTVSLTPPSVSLQPSQNQAFTATVTGTSSTGVTWSFSPALGSLVSGATTLVYVAPSTAPTTQSVTITATSMANPSKTATAVITLLQAVTVSLIPSAVSLAPSGTQPFTATVLGTSNTAVTWSINPSVGTISSAGLYTAPSSILTSQTVTVTAQSVADPTKSATRVVSLQTASFNVKSFGAKGDGSTNDKAAFDAAFAAIQSAGGGSLYVPTGQYVYNSSSSFLDTQTFTGETSNVIVFGDGPGASVINFTGYKGLVLGVPRMDINLHCIAPPSTGCVTPGWPLPSYYLMNNVSSGSSVKLLTPAHASNFTTGGVVFIESGDAAPGIGEAPAHFEFNTVVSANASTGVIVLQNPLSDAYDSSNPTYPPMIAQISVVPTNITIHDLGFTMNIPLPNGVIISPEGTMNTLIYNCAFTGLGGTTAIVWNAYSWHATITNSTFSGVSFDIGEAAAYYEFTNNIVENVPSSYADSFNSSGGGRQFLIDGNQFIGLGTSTYNTLNIGGSAAYGMPGLQISNNSIQLPNIATYPNGISVFDAAGAIISGNTCSGVTGSGNGGACVALRGGAVNSQVSQNSVNSQDLRYGVLLQSGASGTAISGNQFTSTGIGIAISSGATNTNVGCNTFVSNGTNTSDKGSGTMYMCAVH
jgi:hypothetical protein